MTSSNGIIFSVTSPFWRESTGHRWIPLTKASYTELCGFLWSASKQTVEQIIWTPVIWDPIGRIMTSLWWAALDGNVLNVLWWWNALSQSNWMKFENWHKWCSEADSFIRKKNPKNPPKQAIMWCGESIMGTSIFYNASDDAWIVKSDY